MVTADTQEIHCQLTQQLQGDVQKRSEQKTAQILPLIQELREAAHKATADALDIDTAGVRREGLISPSLFSKLVVYIGLLYARSVCQGRRNKSCCFLRVIYFVICYTIGRVPTSTCKLFQNRFTERAVFAKKTIPALTVFGPLVGALTAEPPSEFAFVCHNAGDDGTRYFQLDSDATSNWMKYVRFARNADERNVTVCEVPASAFPDVGSDAPSLVIFMTTRIILPNEELKVGYSRGYSEVVQRLRARHTVLLDVAGATELHHQDIAASLPHSQPEAAASQRLISEDNQERSSDADGTNVCGAIWYSAVMPTPSELAVTVLKHFQARRRRTEMSAASPWLEQSESVQLPSGLTAHVQRVISKCTDQRANADRCTVSTGTQTDVVPCPLGETTYDDGDDSAQPPRNVHCRPGLPHRQSVHSDVSMEFESAKTRLPVKQMKKLRRGAREKAPRQSPVSGSLAVRCMRQTVPLPENPTRPQTGRALWRPESAVR
ncbi:uncharacterized protein LOC129585539 [Paramacrobiotus metropolitanus]|uniref:uncharacterized protein LOC129585539 n=1 Tax=Paramacrobiotus metropolitanus TaxID=2943436 RepID=UPI0024462A7C|nr:uncharacterized protein LOC129585539 [Paramacrobiotus metropolitanus]